MSQPFFYIFAIIVIGLILVFGFYYIDKLLKQGCEIETIDFVSSMQAKLNEYVNLGYGSSFECSFAQDSNSNCVLNLPSSVKGVCFIDMTKSFSANDIPFDDVKQFAKLGGSAKRNVFFSTVNGASCKAEPANLKKMTTDGVVCINANNRSASFIMENTGREVIIKKA